MSLRWENMSCKRTQAVSHIRMQLESFVAATWDSSPGVVTNVMTSAILDRTRIIFCIARTKDKKQIILSNLATKRKYGGGGKKNWKTLVGNVLPNPNPSFHCKPQYRILKYRSIETMFLTSIDILLRESPICLHTTGNRLTITSHWPSAVIIDNRVSFLCYIMQQVTFHREPNRCYLCIFFRPQSSQVCSCTCKSASSVDRWRFYDSRERQWHRMNLKFKDHIEMRFRIWRTITVVALQPMSSGILVKCSC